jgi:hypothetical protein
MARKRGQESQESGTLKRAATAVKQLLTRGRHEEDQPAETARETRPPQRREPEKSAPRPVRREADIPLDVLDRAYTPPLTSSKASFRSDGVDHEQDQEFAKGVGEAGWRDEDHYSNKSGDPRIGTRGRTYEPAEAQPEPRD